MRFGSSLSLWILAASLLGVIGLSQATVLEGRSLPRVPTLTLNRREMTNAERLARGLPLRPPTRRRIIAVRSEPSPIPQTTYTGKIQVHQQSDNTLLGYVAPSGVLGILGTFTNASSSSAGITVAFTLPTGTTSGTSIDLKILGSGGDLLGFINAPENTPNPADISVSSRNVLMLGSVFPPGSSPGATPADIPNAFKAEFGVAVSAESSIWNVDVITGLITAQWINSDASRPNTILILNRSNALGAVGGPNGELPNVPISLHFVPAL